MMLIVSGARRYVRAACVSCLVAAFVAFAATAGLAAAVQVVQPPPRALTDPGAPSASLSRCAAAVPQRPDAGGVAAVRAGVLSRGVNMTDAFSPAVSMAQLQSDFSGLRNAGFRHVRLPISPSWVLTWPMDAPPDVRLARLDDTVCAAISSGLAVILDAHPEDKLALKDAAGPDVLGQLAAAWDRLAGRYAIFPPSAVVFEALNEPGRKDRSRWERDQRVLLSHIRRAAPRHTVLLTASPDSTAAALSGLEPAADGNVAYVFHFYSPMVFTHQGAEWANPNESSIRGLAYPAVPGNVAFIQRHALTALQAPLAKYRTSYADPSALRAEIATAANWAGQHGVPLVVTEFGVYGAAAPPASRLAWLSDVRQALEARGIGWTVWEYRGGFGIDAGLKQPCSTPAGMRQALGICPAEVTRQ